MPAPAAIVVIVNSSAGTAAKRGRIETELADLFRAAGREAEVIALQRGQDATAVARDASARASIVVAAGGDGTVSSIAAAVVDSTAALGVLPLGTLNHFAKDLHIPLDLAGAIAVVAAGHIGQVDVGQVNDRVFVNNSSIGLYPSIVEEREALRRRGHRKWTAMALATVRVLRKYRGVTVSVDIDGRRHTWRTPFVFIGNNEYDIDGPRVGGRSRLDAGRLVVYRAPRVRARHLPVLVAKALLGRRQAGDFEILPAVELWIDAGGARHLRVAVDGEVLSMRAPLHYRARPNALRVVVPRS
jgi:diacylglycerol kinase family enzyme